jgi:hypothetical protein
MDAIYDQTKNTFRIILNYKTLVMLIFPQLFHRVYEKTLDFPVSVVL